MGKGERGIEREREGMGKGNNEIYIGKERVMEMGSEKGNREGGVREKERDMVIKV